MITQNAVLMFYGYYNKECRNMQSLFYYFYKNSKILRNRLRKKINRPGAEAPGGIGFDHADRMSGPQAATNAAPTAMRTRATTV